MSPAVLGSIFHRFVPAFLYGKPTAWPSLAQIENELEGCRSVAAAARLLQRSKAELYAGLYAARFSPFAAQALTVKILNLFLARYHLRARSSTVLSRPFGLVIDPSNVCRLACPGCVHSDRNQALEIFDWPNGTLPESRIAALLELYGPYAIGAYFCNYGEPLLNLQTPRFIRLAKTYLMSTALSTSLSVQRFDAEAYVRSGLDFMVISIDGATQPVYQRFRRNGDLELVFGNIRKLVEAKRRLRRRTPVLSWNFLAFEHNVHEIPAAVQKARKLGVNQFRVVNPFDVTWDDPSIRPAAVEGGVRRLDTFSTASDPENWNPFPEEAPKAAVTSAFEKLWSDPPAVNDRPSSGHTCHWLYKNIVMDAGGRIMPCCGGPPRDGSLVFDTLEGAGRDVFNSEKYRQARLWFSTGYVSENAPYCTRCEWDHATVNIGSQEILRYFRSADPAFFDRRSLRLLSEC